MTDGFLSDRAQRLVDYVRSGAIDARDLIRAYADWRSSSAAVGDDAGNRIVADVRRRLGITDPGSDAVEAVGDAIRVLISSDDHASMQLWHDTKLAALGGDDHDKKLIALRHLDLSDLSDDACVAAILESLANPDDTLALTFAFTVGTILDPASDAKALPALFDELQTHEVHGSSRAAVFGSTIAQVFEHHPSAVPPHSLVEEWVATIMRVDDAFSYTPAVEVAACAVSRGGATSLLADWLTAPTPRLWLFGVHVLNLLGSEWSSDHAACLSPLLTRLRDHLLSPGPADGLHAAHRQWLIDQLVRLEDEARTSAST